MLQQQRRLQAPAGRDLGAPNGEPKYYTDKENVRLGQAPRLPGLHRVRQVETERGPQYLQHEALNTRRASVSAARTFIPKVLHNMGSYRWEFVRTIEAACSNNHHEGRLNVNRWDQHLTRAFPISEADLRARSRVYQASPDLSAALPTGWNMLAVDQAAQGRDGHPDD